MSFLWTFVANMDTFCVDFLYAHRDPALTKILLGITQLGNIAIIAGIALILAVWLGIKKRYADAFGLAVSVGGSGVAIALLKFVIQRPRPELWMQATPEGPLYSFPSAHAGFAIALYGFCMYLLLQSHSTRTARIMLALLPIAIFFIGFSRLYLGVHFPTDVFAGYVLGSIFLWLGIRARLEFLRQ